MKVRFLQRRTQLQMRGREVVYLIGLISRRTLVRIQPHASNKEGCNMQQKACFMKYVHARTGGGGWFCECCVSSKRSKRKRLYRTYKRGFKQRLDKIDKCADAGVV